MMTRRDRIFRTALFACTALETIGVMFGGTTLLTVGLVGAVMTALLWTWMDAADASVARDKKRAARRAGTR